MSPKIKETQETFGTYIRKHRLELDMTQADVAKKVGVAQNFIAYLENDQRSPSTDIIRKLSEILNLPSDKLYFLAHQEDLEDIVTYDHQRQKVLLKMSPILMKLKNDKDLRKRHQILDEEIEQLASIKSRGEIRSKEDYVFLLMTLRQVFK